MRLHEVIDLRERLERRYPKMGPVERRLAHYVLENASEIPFQSITEVAAVLGVHPSTVTRFAQRLGYKGYPALQRVLRGNLREAMAPRVPDEGEVWPRFLELEKEALLALPRCPRPRSRRRPEISPGPAGCGCWGIGSPGPRRACSPP